MRTEVAQCVKNPFVYGAERMEKTDCSCVEYTNPSCPTRFYFNETTFWTIPTQCLGTSGLISPRGALTPYITP